MPTKLILRDPEPSGKKNSPFVVALEGLRAGERLDIACPYINLAYLSEMLREQDAWRLLTDMDEWLRSLGKTDQSRTVEFIRQHQGQIHHYPKLHAKVVIGKETAFLGSANLTDSGLLVREEAAVLLDDQSLVQQLQDWFQRLWDKSAEPKIAEVEEFTKDPANARSPQPKSQMKLSSPVANKRYLPLKLKPKKEQVFYADTPEAERRKHLVETIKHHPTKKQPNRQWVDDYFNYVKEVIEITGMASEDPRLVTSCTQDGKIDVSIGPRLVLGTYHSRKRLFLIIAPWEYRPDDTPSLRCTHYEKKGFLRRKREPRTFAPRLVGFDITNLSELPTELMIDWRILVAEQPNIFDRSNYKQYHDPLVYRAAVDLAYRKDLLDEAFSS